ncbi:CinA family protein [Rhodococcus tibetensis]|uniref:CinA family protein n=1 Tax=Rhodococcus tibetensis TaxID=2965064 RepID=A0ABT1QAF7_9NOCA|nr:CinA family protein [Rhodococcus sp. FXJ9.536]MCQ4118107.1 CinA family protein [Rhodococcus sp. FXJ9.536]
MGSNETIAERIAEQAGSAQVSVATAESLTGGQISCVLGAAPSSSDWYRGSIVAYSSEVKHQVLKVPEGPVVSEASARAMVAAVAEILGADVAVAVTGAGGPDPQDGQPPGTVWFGIIARGEVSAELQKFDGDPQEVVEATTGHALSLLAKTLDALSQ